MRQALAWWHWLTPNWRKLGAAAFKMVVGLRSPQLSRFFHTGTVFDSPALQNNCHKRLIIHYRFFCINISSVTDVNASLGYLCHRLTASPKFISSLLLHTSVNQLTSFPFSFIGHCVSLSLGFMSAFQLQRKTLSPIFLHCLANHTHNHMISRSHRFQL